MSIKEQIEQIEHKMFLIDMVDRWTWEDRQAYHRLREQLATLKAQVEGQATH